MNKMIDKTQIQDNVSRDFIKIDNLEINKSENNVKNRSQPSTVLVSSFLFML